MLGQNPVTQLLTLLGTVIGIVGGLVALVRGFATSWAEAANLVLPPIGVLYLGGMGFF